MRVLVLGKRGQVAQALSADPGAEIICLGRPDVDLTNLDSVATAINKCGPEIVLNAAAYTAVDMAETERDAAFSVNETGSRNAAIACRDVGLPLLHLSTDCVFDGELDRPYRPDDVANPIGAYGESKWAGERAVSATLENHVIVRVSWLFSTYADNFVRTMLSLAKTRDRINVVCDQVGNPTFTPALASGLVQIARHIVNPYFDDWGTYHMAGNGEIDRASFAAEIFGVSKNLGGPTAEVARVLSLDYGAPAKRPLNARLDMGRTSEVFGVTLPPWQDGLAETVSCIIDADAE